MCHQGTFPYGIIEHSLGKMNVKTVWRVEHEKYEHKATAWRDIVTKCMSFCRFFLLRKTPSRDRLAIIACLHRPFFECKTQAQIP